MTETQLWTAFAPLLLLFPCVPLLAIFFLARRDRQMAREGKLQVPDIFRENDGIPIVVRRFGNDHVIYEIVRKCGYRNAYFGLDGLED